MTTVLKHPTILYAEDDQDDFDSLKDALAQVNDNYFLEHSRNGLEVISRLEDNSKEIPRLIVLDLNMPLLDGKETLQWLKKSPQFQHIPIMVFTTSSREEDMALCKSHGCTFFRKPTLYRDLLHIVQKMLQMCSR